MIIGSALAGTYFLAGICFGSLANILIDRHNNGEAGASALQRFSYDKKIIIRYLLVNIACAVLFAGMAVYAGSWIPTVFLCALTFVLLCVSCIDIDSREIPDSFLLFGAAAGILWVTVSCFVPLGAPRWYDALPGVLAGALPLFLIDRATILLLDKDAFGYGDMKLMAMSGLFLGWKLALIALALAVILGGVYGAVMLCSRRLSKGSYIAFAPFLSIGVIAALWFGGLLVIFFR